MNAEHSKQSREVDRPLFVPGYAKRYATQLMTAHTEFSLSVTVWALEEQEYQPCSELNSICQLLNAPSFTQSPAERFPSHEPATSVSTLDTGCYVRVDLAGDPTDQMEVVTIQIRCANAVADTVDALLRCIQSRSEVESALLRGNLGFPAI